MRRGSAIPLAMLLIGAACGGAGTATSPSPSTAATQATATKPARVSVKVSVGSAASLLYLPWDLAKALNYFEDENLDVQLNYAAAGTDAATALLSGSVDFTGNSIDHSIKAQIAGKPTKMVVSFAKLPGTGFVVRGASRTAARAGKASKARPVVRTRSGSGPTPWRTT